MARRASRRRDVLTSITNPLRDPLAELLPSNFTAVRFDLTEVEDRRTWSPEPILDDLPRDLRGVPTPIRPAQPARKAQRSRSVAGPSLTPRPIFAFVDHHNPIKRVAICVRRKIRKEIMHALKFAGKGGGKRRPRRNSNSNIRC